MKITDAQRAAYMASHCRWSLDDYAIDDAGMPTECTLRNRANPYLPETMRMVPERTCRKVPGKMHYGQRRPKCSECGYGLGDDRWGWCPKCGAKIEEAE